MVDYSSEFHNEVSTLTNFAQQLYNVQWSALWAADLWTGHGKVLTIWFSVNSGDNFFRVEDQ